MLKRASLGFVLTAALPSAQADDGVWTPDAKTIAAADRAIIRMYQPPEDPPLKTYSRYYLGVISAGHRMILGKLLAPGRAETRKPNGPPGSGKDGLVHIVTDAKLMPAYADGGCGIENVTYDVTAAKITVAFCNIAGPGGPPPPVPHPVPRVSPAREPRN